MKQQTRVSGGSANVSSVSKSGEGFFDIQLAEPVANTDVALVTPAGIRFASYYVNGGVLEVNIYDSGGDPADPSQFTFLVYRP